MTALPVSVRDYAKAIYKPLPSGTGFQQVREKQGMDTDLGALAASAAALRVKLAGAEKQALSGSMRAHVLAEQVKRWLTGRRFVDLQKTQRPTFPAVGGDTAVQQEAEALAKLSQRRGLLRDLHDTPYLHVKDRVVGGMVGAPAGYAADNAVGYDEDSSLASKVLRKALAVGGGAYLGGRGLNATMNTGRQYLANTSHLYGYGAANVKVPTSWQDLKQFPGQFWRHGVKDQPSASAFLGTGPAKGQKDPRHELLRRYLGIHKDSPDKDFFLRRQDGSYGFNPATVNKSSPYWKHYVEPLQADERLAARFHWKPQEPMKLTDMPQNARARVERRLERLRETKRLAEEARLSAEAAAKLEATRPRLIVPGQETARQPFSLTVPGTMQRAKGLEMGGKGLEMPKGVELPGQSQRGEGFTPLGKKPSAAPPAEAKPVKIVINEQGSEPWWRRPGSFVRDKYTDPKAPRYESDASRNPMSTIFGSHDTRDVASMTRDTLGGHYQKGVEVGDLWDVAPASWEKREFGTYLRGLMRTSPRNWGRFLKQEATHAHPDSVVGKKPQVGPRMASYGMRSMAEGLLSKEAPVVRQKMLLDYRAPDVKTMTGEMTDRLYRGPTSAHLRFDAPAAPRTGTPEGIKRLQRRGAIAAGATGLATLPALGTGVKRLSEDPGQQMAGASPVPELQGRERFQAGIGAKIKGTLGNWYNRLTGKA